MECGLLGHPMAHAQWPVSQRLELSQELKLEPEPVQIRPRRMTGNSVWDPEVKPYPVHRQTPVEVNI